MNTNPTITTPRRSKFALLATVALALVCAMPAAKALTLGATYLQGGIGLGRVNGDASSVDMTTYNALFNYNIRSEGLIGLDLRGSYSYGDVSSGVGGFIQDSDLNLIVSLPKTPIVVPFGIIGASYDKYTFNHHFGHEDGWNAGYNVGVGAELKLLHALPITATVVYKHADYESVTYALDATFWLGKIGIGGNISYEDGQGGTAVNVTQGNVYLAIRF